MSALSVVVVVKARRSEAVRFSSTDIIALEGMRKGNIVASSEGRKAERIRPVPGPRGLPRPPRLRVSVPAVVCLLKRYSLTWNLWSVSKVG